MRGQIKKLIKKSLLLLLWSFLCGTATFASGSSGGFVGDFLNESNETGGFESFDSGGDSSSDANQFNRGLLELQKGGLDSQGQIIPKQGQAVNPIIWVMRMIMTLMTFVGIGTLIGILYGGFLYMTSAGETTQIDKAKRTLRNSVIGLIIILSSYSITWFVVTQVIDTTAAFGGGFFLFNF